MRPQAPTSSERGASVQCPGNLIANCRPRRQQKWRTPGRKGTGTMAGPLTACLAFGNDRRGRGRSFSLADVLRTAGDAQESEHRGHS